MQLYLQKNLYIPENWVVVQFEWEVPQRLKPGSTHSLSPRLKPGVYPRAIAKLQPYRKLSCGFCLLFSIVPVFQLNLK